jgi:hypothetical protein
VVLSTASRLGVAAARLAWLPLLACAGSSTSGTCPGNAQGTVQVLLTRAEAHCAGAARPAGGVDACAAAGIGTDCAGVGLPACCFEGLYPATRTLGLTIAFDAGDPSGTGAAWACTGQHGALPLAGAHAGRNELQGLTLEVRHGAVLAACAASCQVAVVQVLDGTLLRDAGGLVTGFTGTLVETDSPCAACEATCGGACQDDECNPCVTTAACGTCTVPCGATWNLTTVR